MIHSPFIDGYAKSVSPNFQLDVLQNMYVENAIVSGSGRYAQTGAKTFKALIGAPGSALFYDLGDGPVRSQLSIEGYDYVVAGGNVWQKDPLDNWTLLGFVVNDGRSAKIVADSVGANIILFIRSAGRAYAVIGGVVIPQLGPLGTWQSGTLLDIAFLHGYFIGLEDNGAPTGGAFFISAPNDPQTWDPLDFATVPSTADKLRALTTSHDELYVFGSTVIQPFYDSGNVDFPLVPNQSGTMEVGTVAKDSICALAANPASDDRIIYFLSETPNGHGQLIKLDGYTPTIVSTPPIEAIWQTASEADIESVSCFSFQENGHSFVQVNFPETSPSPKGSWRYDASTNKWAKVTWTNPINATQEAHRGISHCFNLGRHLIGDRAAGVIWQMNTRIYSDSNPANTSSVVPMVSAREVLLPSEGTKNMFISRIELLGETGVGDGSGSGDGDNPQVQLEMSGNAGHSYDPNPLSVSMGKQGEYDTRMVFTTIGAYRQPAVRISVSAPVKRWFTGLDLQIKAGTS